MTRCVHGHKTRGVNFPRLTTPIAINLSGNPGFESFRPVADAGPGGTLSAGQTVTLGGPGTSGGPWGSNLIYRWGQQDASDNSVSTVALSSTEVAKPTFMAPALAAETVVNLELRVSGKGDANLLLEATSTATITIRALAPTALAVVSKPVSGDTYKLGETVAVAVTFGDRVLVDTSLGTPELALTVGTATRRAAYVRGMGRHSKSPRRIAEDIWGAERVAAEWNSDSWMRSQIRRWKPKATALADGGRRDLVPRSLPEE